MINDDFAEINRFAHYQNWLPDWLEAEKIYVAFPDAYSVLTPFAYVYLEELIRSTTSEYGLYLLDENGEKKKKRKTCEEVINLAISENREKTDYVKQLKNIKSKYYKHSSDSDSGDNRHSTLHGYMHADYWTKESFEELIHDIASISQYSGF